VKDGILATVCNQLLAFRCENLSVDTGAALLPYRLKSQTSTIAAKLYAPPLVDDGNNPASAHFDSGQALHMLLSTYCQMDLALLPGMYFPWPNSANGY
jgi:hypothetical protein